MINTKEVMNKMKKENEYITKAKEYINYLQVSFWVCLFMFMLINAVHIIKLHYNNFFMLLFVATLNIIVVTVMAVVIDDKLPDYLTKKVLAKESDYFDGSTIDNIKSKGNLVFFNPELCDLSHDFNLTTLDKVEGQDVYTMCLKVIYHTVEEKREYTINKETYYNLSLAKVHRDTVAMRLSSFLLQVGSSVVLTEEDFFVCMKQS